MARQPRRSAAALLLSLPLLLLLLALALVAFGAFAIILLHVALLPLVDGLSGRLCLLLGLTLPLQALLLDPRVVLAIGPDIIVDVAHGVPPLLCRLVDEFGRTRRPQEIVV